MLHKDDFPGLLPGDLVEIYHPDNETEDVIKAPRLIHMITKSSIYPDNGLQKPINKETIYLESSLADTFQLPNYMDVIVTKVDKNDVALDSVEVTFKEQYVGRSEMWRLANSLHDTCVYLNKKVELCQGQVRCQVNEMWSQGVRVSSGYITPDTKVVFRSPTAMVYLFIQMSSEMWQYDVHGELFFEKAVDGFLSAMFNRWEKNGSSHEVTIVLFSRCFYKASSIREFPERMQDCLQVGYNNSFYEDFYRVVVQNERFDDWSPTVRQLKEIFTHYKAHILNYHKHCHEQDVDEVLPEAVISSAAQGNFLEVLNMSLNTFEHHYLNRNLDRTGQQSIVLTPGVGIFEVDRELTMITKQRIIDSGVGSDLICVGEQPLHAVPLFKYHHKDKVTSPVDDFSMPHWINLSFFERTDHKVGYSNYKTRINTPRSIEKKMKVKKNKKPKIRSRPTVQLTEDELFDMADIQDDFVFELPKENEPIKRKMSDPELSLMASSDLDPHNPNRDSNEVMSPVSPGAVFSSSWDDSHLDKAIKKVKNDNNLMIGSIDTTFDHQAIKKYLLRPGRALINPFVPSHTTVRVTSNRRRWTHIFPKGPTGQYQQVHHDLQDVLHQISGTKINSASSSNQDEDIEFEQPKTGVDWKSLTIPASLPLTTDYIPDPISLVHDYVVNSWFLNPDETINDNASERSPLDSKNIFPTNEEVFTELVSQRLSQGFQMILLTPQQEEAINATTASASSVSSSASVTPVSSSRSFAAKLKLKKSNATSTPSKKLSVVIPKAVSNNPTAEYWLSIGRIFHRVSLSANRQTIKVTRYRPRRPYNALNIQYRYRFGAPDNDTYEVSWVDFHTEKLENFNWNHMDFYVCTRGDKEFLLTENLKYWRFRLMAIPLTPYLKDTKKIMENCGANQQFCDIYKMNLEPEIISDLKRGFTRFLEVCLNRIKKPITMASKRSGMLGDRPAQMTKSVQGIREHRANTISVDHRSQMFPQKKRHPSGGQGNQGSLLSLGLAYLSPDNSKGSSGSIEQPVPHVGSFENQHQAELQEPPKSSTVQAEGLKLTSTLVEIIEVMKSALNFVNKVVQGMPPMTFLAFEAVIWILDNVEGVENQASATRILKNMQEKKLICHASGNFSQAFFNGFAFFCLNPNPKSSIDAPYNGNLETFKNDWVEVEFSPDDPEPQPYEFLQNSLTKFAAKLRKRETLAAKSFYKSVTLNVDQAGRSDRKEWGHIKYQHYYDTTEAFEIALQWSVATGAIISEMLHTWARKAQGYGISLIPVPSDPFALPITLNSDPVRGPIFIEMDTDVISFEAFAESTWDQRLFLFREAIAHKFGFINSATDRNQQPSSAMFSTHHQYIHCTGNMFLLIPTQLQLQTGIQVT